jgi:THO complex subunit 3
MTSYSQSRVNNLQSQFAKSTVKSFQAHNSKIHSVAWNVDGKRLASGSTDKTVAVFAFENREKLVSPLWNPNMGLDDSKRNSFNPKAKESVFKGHTDLVDQLCWHPTNPDLLATASGDKTVRIYDCRSMKSIKTIDTPGSQHYLTRFRQDSILTNNLFSGENINICWSADGKSIAVGNKDDLIAFIDTRTYKYSWFDSNRLSMILFFNFFQNIGSQVRSSSNLRLMKYRGISKEICFS